MVIPAVLCYVRSQGRTLMMHRVKKRNDLHAGKWNGLGGKLEPGETPEEAAIREVREESGLLIARPFYHGLLVFPAFDGTNDWHVHVFTAREFTGTPAAECGEGRLEWIPDAEVLTLPLWEGDRVFLPWLSRPGTFSAKFRYENGRFSGHQVVFYEAASPGGAAPGRE